MVHSMLARSWTCGRRTVLPTQIGTGLESTGTSWFRARIKWRQGPLFYEDKIWEPVWRDILEKRGLDTLDSETVHKRLQKTRTEALNSLDEIDWLRVSRLPNGDSWRGRAYARLIGDLYKGLSLESGASVIVDSSKNVDTAWISSQIDSVDTVFVHITRDPRGVIYSRQRRLRDGDKYRLSKLRVLHSIKDAWNWRLEKNKAQRFKRLAHINAISIEYEKLVSHPKQVIQGILKTVGLPAESVTFEGDRSICLRENHAIGGNRNKFKTGIVTFKEDTKWLDGINKVEAALIRTISNP